MTTTRIKIGGMTCQGCVRSVTNAIQDLPGIGEIEVSLEKAEACVEHGPLVAAEDVRQAVEDAGFDAELL